MPFSSDELWPHLYHLFSCETINFRKGLSPRRPFRFLRSIHPPFLSRSKKAALFSRACLKTLKYHPTFLQHSNTPRHFLRALQVVLVRTLEYV